MIYDCYCSSSYPEPVDVVINEVTATIDAPVAALSQAYVSGTESLDLTIQIVSISDVTAAIAGSFRLDIWFTDEADPGSDITLNPPTTPGGAEEVRVTEDTGEYVLRIAYTGAVRDYYVHVGVGGRITTEALRLGV